MAIDKYQPCPGGLDKKINYCCKELINDLDQISTKIGGQQYEAAIQKIDSLLAEQPDRQCLLATKLSVQMQIGHTDDARQTLQQFLAVAPDNPIALASQSVLDASQIIAGVQARVQQAADPSKLESKLLTDADESSLRAATANLHLALSKCGDNIPAQVYEALGVMGQFLIESGHMLAGREHLVFQYLLARTNPEGMNFQLLVETTRSPDVPIFFKQEMIIPQPPEEAPWKGDYDVAYEAAIRGNWTVAADQFQSLIDRFGGHLRPLRAHAALRCRLPDPAAATTALRQLATFAQTPFDEAIEAEALAQLLDPQDKAEKIDTVRSTWELDGVEAALEQLVSDRRAQSLNIDFAALARDGGPSPKNGFTLLDRELPVSGAALAVDAVPMSLGEVLIYGRQTDREARVEFVASRGERLDQIVALLKEIVGDQLKGEPQETVLGQVAAASEQLMNRPFFPPDTPASFRGQFVTDLSRKMLFDKWPQLANPALDGATPKELAAGDEAAQKRVLAAILVMQEAGHQSMDTETFNQLRKQLGLPELGEAVIGEGEAARLPLVRVSRVDAAKLSDEDLSSAYVQVSQAGVNQAIIKLGQELVKRDSVKETVDVSEIYGRMSQATTNSDQAIQFLHQARDTSTAAGKSPAVWMITEFGLRLARGEGAEAQSLLNTLQMNHLNEPGIPELLMRQLQRFGLVGPDGRPAGRPTGQPAPGAAAMGDPGEAPAAAPEQGGLWTPDGPSPTAPTPKQGGESKIWTPD